MAKTISSAVSMRKEQEDWAAERDLNVLMDCEKIEKDPKRLAAAQALAKKRLMDLASIAAEGPKD